MSPNINNVTLLGTDSQTETHSVPATKSVISSSSEELKDRSG